MNKRGEILAEQLTATLVVLSQPSHTNISSVLFNRQKTHIFLHCSGGLRTKHASAKIHMIMFDYGCRGGDSKVTAGSQKRADKHTFQFTRRMRAQACLLNKHWLIEPEMICNKNWSWAKRQTWNAETKDESALCDLLVIIGLKFVSQKMKGW